MKFTKTARILTLSVMLPFAAFATTSASAEDDEGSAAKGAATGAAVGAVTGVGAGKGAAAGAVLGGTKSDEPSLCHSGGSEPGADCSEAKQPKNLKREG
jgi:hypothetical protein